MIWLRLWQTCRWTEKSYLTYYVCIYFWEWKVNCARVLDVFYKVCTAVQSLSSIPVQNGRIHAFLFYVP